jgi:hypothetical protein
LGRVGTTVYASELVRALTRLREAYGDYIRVLHGFPVMTGGRTKLALGHCWKLKCG